MPFLISVSMRDNAKGAEAVPASSIAPASEQRLKTGVAPACATRTAAAAVEKTAAQAAAAKAAAASAAEAAAAAHIAVAAMTTHEQETVADAAKGEATELHGQAVYSRRRSAGEEAASNAAKAAEEAATAAAEAALGAAAVAEAANVESEYHTPTQLEEFLVSQGLRVAVALETAATAAAAAAEAAGQVATSTARYALETSSGSIAAAAQRCHEAAASAVSSALSALSAAAASTADSISATAAAARAALEEVTGAATRKIVDAAKAFEDTIAAKTAALESTLLWRQSVESYDSEMSSNSSSFGRSKALRRRTSSQSSSSKDSRKSHRNKSKGRSSLLRYFSSDYEREGSEGGAPEIISNEDEAAHSRRGNAAIAAFLADSRYEGLSLSSEIGSGDSIECQGTMVPLQPPPAAVIAATTSATPDDSVDAIVAAAAAEAAACEAIAEQQLHQRHEANDSRSQVVYRSEDFSAAASEVAQARRPPSRQLKTKAAPPSKVALPVVPAGAVTSAPADLETPAADEDKEEGVVPQKAVRKQVMHASEPPQSAMDVQDYEHQTREQVHSAAGLEDRSSCMSTREWRIFKVTEDAATSARSSCCNSSSEQCNMNRTTRCCEVATDSKREPLGAHRNGLQLGVACSDSSRNNSCSCSSLLECSLEEFMDCCASREQDRSTCSSSWWKDSGSGDPGLPLLNLQQRWTPRRFAPEASVEQAYVAVDAVADDQENDAEAAEAIRGRIGRALLECPHFSMPTIALLQQSSGSNNSKIFVEDGHELKQFLQLFPFACVPLSDLMSLINYMGDPRVHTRVGGLEITASALEDPMSFTLLAEMLQHLQQNDLLPCLFLLRITGYSNADLRACMSPEQQRRIFELQQSASGKDRPLRNDSLAAFAASRAMGTSGVEGPIPTRNSRCNRVYGNTRSRSTSSSTSRSSTNSITSSNNTKRDEWVKQPLYVPPMQLQRSLRSLCRLLPQLRRLELFAPSAQTRDAPEGTAVEAREPSATERRHLAFSKLSRVFDYISPFAVLAQAMRFELLSVRVTKLLLCCSNCCGLRATEDDCMNAGHRRNPEKAMRRSRCRGKCCSRATTSNVNHSSCRKSKGCPGEQRSSRTSTDDKFTSSIAEHFSEYVASREDAGLVERESSASRIEEADRFGGVIKRTVCMSCEVLDAPIYVASAVSASSRRHSWQRFVLDSVVFSAASQIDI